MEKSELVSQDKNSEIRSASKLGQFFQVRGQSYSTEGVYKRIHDRPRKAITQQLDKLDNLESLLGDVWSKQDIRKPQRNPRKQIHQHHTEYDDTQVRQYPLEYFHQLNLPFQDPF